MVEVEVALCLLKDLAVKLYVTEGCEWSAFSTGRFTPELVFNVDEG
jgi:hypothetical protein